MRFMTLRTSVAVRFSEEMHNRLKELSDQSGIPAADLVRRATEEYLKKIQTEGKLTISIVREERAEYGKSHKPRLK